MRKTGFRFTLLLSFLVLAACSNQASVGTENNQTTAPSSSATKKPVQPIELVFYGVGYSEAPFFEGYGNSIKAKFPHITVKFVRVESGKMPEMITSGAKMDIQLMRDFQMRANMVDYSLNFDHTDLIKKYNYNTTLINTQMMDLVKMISDGKLYGLPVNLYIPGLYYNKALFDKFGVAYPKDGMTWDESYELAKRMTRQEAGVQYRGMVVAFQALTVQNQLSLGYVDKGTQKSLYTTNNKWQRHVDALTRFYKLPGNEVIAATITGAAQNNFFYKDQVAAMFATVADPTVFATNPTVNMDVATIPTFSDLPGISGQPSSTVIDISSASKLKEEAFEVLMYLTSKEYQLEKAKKGTLTVLTNDADIRKAFGTDEASLKGKNVQALNPTKFAVPGTSSNYDHFALPSLLKHMNLVAENKSDVNTALRNAGEEADKAIADSLKK